MNQKLSVKSILRSAVGFTLAEILMVVVILGILSAVALPRLAPQKEKAYVSEALGILSAIRQAEEAHRLEFSSYCAVDGGATVASCTWAQLGFDAAPDSDFWTYDMVADATTVTITAERVDFRWSGAGAFPLTAPTITLTEAGVYGGDHPNRPT